MDALGSDVVIQAENLTKVYSSLFSGIRRKAVDCLNLSINKGELFGFLGPNGSGKTTSMKIFLGLLFPTEGRALVLGKSPFDVATKNRIGFLPEESYLYRFLTADETLDFYGKLFGMPRRERKKKINELLELFNLTHVRNRPLREYSRGMVRRIGFAQALINDPDVIFLDEPTSGMDPIVAAQMKDLMVGLRRRGKTIMMSSHLLADIEDVCDRIAIMHEGKLLKVGSMQDSLALKDQIQITIRNLPAEAQARIKDVVTKAGAEVLDVTHPSETLESLFLRTIKESKARDDSAGDKPGP